MRPLLDRWADPRLLITLLLIGLFAWAYSANTGDDTMKGALIAAFAGAWGYWLGSSRGSADNAARADKALDIAAAAQTVTIERAP